MVWRSLWRWLKMPLNKSRVQEGWVVFELVCSSPSIWECKVFWLLSASVFLVWALVHLTSPISPKFYVREPFSSPCYAHKFPLLSFSPCVCPSVVASSLLSNLSCKHTSAFSKYEHTGFLPTSSIWLGKLPHFLRWESTERHPLVSHILCIYITLFSSLLMSVCGAPIFWPQCLRGWGSSALPFPLVCSNVL